MVAQVAKRFMTAAARSGQLEKYMGLGPLDHLFKNVERDQFAQFHDHVRKHATLPSEETLKGWWGDLPTTPEPPSFYLEHLTNRHMQNALTKHVSEANELVQSGQPVDAALQLVSSLQPEIFRRHGAKMVTIKQAYELAGTNYFQQLKMGDDYGIKIGYPVVDSYGGLVPGDVLSWVGRPAAGKSFLTLRAAHAAYKQGRRAGFLSMEMNNLISAQRLVALDAQIPLNGLKLQKGSGLSTPQLQKLNKAGQAAGDDLHLIDGNLSASVEDIFNMVRLLQLDMLVIDGAYMLKHPNPRLGRFERVAENCELIKKEIAGVLGVPVICSWQFSREAAKKLKSKKGDQVDLEDIGYSDAIGQISSIALGLLEEETVETMNRKRVTIMKGRNGETGSFDIHWQFNPVMNFDHAPEAALETMSFL